MGKATGDIMAQQDMAESQRVSLAEALLSSKVSLGHCRLWLLIQQSLKQRVLGFCERVHDGDPLPDKSILHVFGEE
jgi:hypothetical protein